MSEPPRSLESFEAELAACGDWRDAFRAALEGLTNNAFTRSLREIDETNLPTRELRNPDAHATIRDRRTRKALIVSGLFQVAHHKGPGAAADLGICWDTRFNSQRLLHAIENLALSRDSATPPPRGGSRPPYVGCEAVKVFLRALDAVIGEIEKSGWERFDVLNGIAHGGKRRYGTPLDEIRISSWGVRPSLAMALKRISGREGFDGGLGRAPT